MSIRADRLFLLLDPITRRVVDLCTGPGRDGECPQHVAGQPLPCEARRVVPIRQTPANGLPFMVGPREDDRCPMAWVDAGGIDAGNGIPGAVLDLESCSAADAPPPRHPGGAALGA